MSNVESQWRHKRESATHRRRPVDVSRGLMNRTFEDSDLMAHSQDLELEVKARTKYRTQCDEKCEQASGHRRREFAKQYNSFPPRSFRVFERHIGECEMGNARQSNAPSVRSSEFGVCSVGC